MKCYDTDGNEHNRASVDARECVKQLGWTLEPPKADIEDEFSAFNINKLKDFLTMHEVEFKSNASKASLLDLCREVPEEGE